MLVRTICLCDYCWMISSPLITIMNSHSLLDLILRRTQKHAHVAAMAALVLCLSSFPAAGQQDVSAAAHTTDQFEPTTTTLQGALADSLRLLAMEHLGRVAFQSKTRRELGGPFLRDYIRSVKLPVTWEDRDRWYVNYVGHPIHGAAAGFIWLDHEDGAHDPALADSPLSIGQVGVVRLRGLPVTVCILNSDL